MSSWDESDETGASIVAAIREQLERARAALRDAREAARQAARRALSSLSSAAATAAQWATDAAARVSLRALAQEAASIAGSAIGGAVPSWIWLVALLALTRGTRETFRLYLRAARSPPTLAAR